MQRLRPAVARALALLFDVALCAAGDYPSKSIRVVVASPPGSVQDTTMRVLAERLTQSLRQHVVVESKSGATGAIGAETVARAAPDGYTLLYPDL
jgi:tripartite-type tricarboxylate transporter receptor subunit TctC